jgi:hypothetical protein
MALTPEVKIGLRIPDAANVSYVLHHAPCPVLAIQIPIEKNSINSLPYAIENIS